MKPDSFVFARRPGAAGVIEKKAFSFFFFLFPSCFPTNPAVWHGVKRAEGAAIIVDLLDSQVHLLIKLPGGLGG